MTQRIHKGKGWLFMKKNKPDKHLGRLNNNTQKREGAEIILGITNGT